MIRKLLFSKFFIGTITLSAALFLFMHAPYTDAQQASLGQIVQFFVDASFDATKRTQLQATLYYEGNKAQYYVENAYLDTLGGHAREQLMANIQDVSNLFDTKIYHALTRTFGLELIPGIDNNAKITVLLQQMPMTFGGYFSDYNEFPRSRFATSNEREMVYLNIKQLVEPRLAASFLAHEFQHLINFSQKTRFGIIDEIWFNEMMSEIAPTIAGLDDVYDGSNAKFRVTKFLQKPSDPLTIWNAQSEDYSAVNLFGQYLLGQYGQQFFTLLSQSRKTGIEAINEVLASLNRTERFQDIFTNWVITNLINDCAAISAGTFCYNNSNLNYNNIHLNFNVGVDAGAVVSSTDSAVPWQGQWFQYERTLSATRPANHVFSLDFSAPIDTRFVVPYVVFSGGKAELFKVPLDASQNSTIVVKDFGFSADRVVIMPLNQTPDSLASASFRTTARLLEQVPAAETLSLPTTGAESSIISVTAPSISEGALIRAQGDTKVYIVKGKYKRWIQAPQIIDFYGHLRWESIIEVSPDILDNYRDSNVIRFANDPHVYQVSANSTKSWIKTEQEFLALGFTFDMVYEVNEREFMWYR